ncbi:MAG: hypothetical protein PHV53_06855 [Fermentimonas sp.]|nr:hypothetical protein [Fermentimonas sp.]
MIRLLSAVLIVTLLVSCEFNSDKEFFREIEKPGEIMVGLDLAGINPGDPIYIYDDTKVFFTLNSAGKKVLSQEISVNGEILYLTGGSYLTIFKDNLARNGENSLKLTFRLKTGSGSLADIMDAEYYEGEFVFRLIPVDNALDLSIRQGITNDGHFMLEWNKPSFEQLDIANYVIKFKDFRGVDQEELLDGSATSFVDKDYVGGYRSYSITMKFEDDKIKDKTVYYNMSYSGMTSDDINIMFEDLVSTKISWKANKYRCKYFILHNRNDKVVGSAPFESPEVVLQAPVFPEESGFYTVIVAPYNYVDSDISYSSGGVEKFYKYEAPPSPLGMTVNSYSIEDVLIYGRTGNTVKVADAKTFKTIKSIDSPYFENMTSFSVSPNSNKFLLFIGYNWGYGIDNQIYMYDDKNNITGTPKEVKSPKAESRYQRVVLVDDNLIFIANSHETDGVHSYYSLINADTGDSIETLETNLYNNIDLSYDGRRLVMTDRAGFFVNIYDIKETGFELYKSIPLEHFYNPDDLLFCTINPKDSDQVIFSSTTAEKVLVLDIATGESVYINGSFEYVDPFTGRIYSFDDDWDNNKLMNVYNSSDITTPAFSFRAWSYDINAYNDFIMMYQGGLNISKYF